MFAETAPLAVVVDVLPPVVLELDVDVVFEYPVVVDVDEVVDFPLVEVLPVELELLELDELVFVLAISFLLMFYR